MRLRRNSRTWLDSVPSSSCLEVIPLLVEVTVIALIPTGVKYDWCNTYRRVSKNVGAKLCEIQV